MSHLIPEKATCAVCLVIETMACRPIFSRSSHASSTSSAGLAAKEADKQTKIICVQRVPNNSIPKYRFFVLYKESRRVTCDSPVGLNQRIAGLFVCQMFRNRQNANRPHARVESRIFHPGPNEGPMNVQHNLNFFPGKQKTFKYI